MSGGDRFWETSSLEALSPEQWEALCDGCACCCLHKLADADTGDVYYTDVACPRLDVARCRCTAYQRRHEMMPACITLTPETVRETTWLPSTCAYRLRAMGRPLPPWHHLVAGSRDFVHRCGVSIRGKAVTLEAPDDDTLMAHIVDMIPTDTGLCLILRADADPTEGDPP